MHSTIRDIPDNTVAIAIETIDNKFEYMTFADYNECNMFLLKQQQPTHMYELIRNKPQRVYFDLDCEWPHPLTQTIIDEWNTKLREFVNQCCLFIDAHEVAVFSSTYPEHKNKLSAHVIILDKHVSCAKHNALLAFYIKQTFQTVLSSYIDLNVYKTNQLLRIQNSEKRESHRPKKLAYIVGNSKPVDKTSVLYFVQFLYKTTRVDMSIIDLRVVDQFDARGRRHGHYPALS